MQILEDFKENISRFSFDNSDISISSQFYKWMISHTTDEYGMGYMDINDDQELHPDLLPKGHTPIWIKVPEGTPDIEAFNKVEMLPELAKYKENVTVLYFDLDDAVMERCNKLGWSYINQYNITGAENNAFILLGTSVEPEHITRGINLLIIVTNGIKYR